MTEKFLIEKFNIKKKKDTEATPRPQAPKTFCSCWKVKLCNLTPNFLEVLV